jgi:hypothetical protein
VQQARNLTSDLGPLIDMTVRQLTMMVRAEIMTLGYCGRRARGMWPRVPQARSRRTMNRR